MASLSYLALRPPFMIAFEAVHPPSGATTRVVSLGIVTAVSDLIIIEAAVALRQNAAFSDSPPP